jgi:galactonate dehydratase
VKITSVETFLVPPRWLFCKVSTSEGVAGWGEATLEGRSETVRTAVDELEELILGQDAERIEDHWQAMTKAAFYRGGPVFGSAVAGLDQALWDIAGKSLGVPVHRMLGGPVRDRMRVYSWVGGDDPHQVRDAIAEQIDAGFTAVKMNVSGRMSRLASAAELAAVLDRMAAAREALGPDRDFAVDFHGRVPFETAARLIPRLVPFHVLFV